MSVLILVSNGAIQRSFRICSQDQYDVQRTMSNVQCPTYDVQRTMSNVRCPPFDVHRTMSGTCPEMFGTLFGTFGTSGTFLDPWEHCSGTTQHRTTGATTLWRIANINCTLPCPYLLKKVILVYQNRLDYFTALVKSTEVDLCPP